MKNQVCFVKRNQAKYLDLSVFKEEASWARQMPLKEEDANRLGASGGSWLWVRLWEGPGEQGKQAGSASMELLV